MDEKKIALDEAAHEVFAEKGYKHSNITEIAARAGIAVGSFYKYYLSKEEIFLQVYIQENERVRQQIWETTNWQADPLILMESLFDRLLRDLSGNKILLEWNNPKIGGLLRAHYASVQGAAGSHFHQQLLRYVHETLARLGFSEAENQQIVRVYELVYYIDVSVSEEDFAQKTETLKALLHYFIKGVLHSQQKR